MNIEQKHNDLKKEIEILKTNLEKLYQSKINKKVNYDRRKEEFLNNSALLDDKKNKLCRQRKQKISLIDNWSAIVKAVCGVSILILFYPLILPITLKLIEISASFIITMTTMCSFSALLVIATVLSFKIINKIAKKKIEKIKESEEYKQLEEKVKEQEETYTKSLDLIETTKEEYQEAKEQYEEQRKILEEKELILSWFEKTIINCDELPLGEDKTVEKPRIKVREIK